MAELAVPAGRAPHPVSFDVEYPERVSRLTTAFRLILAIPQLIVVYLLLFAFEILSVLVWFGILFTGRYPKSFFEFGAGTMRWAANVFAYVALLRDQYPPFSWERGEYPLALDFERAERQSRFRLFVRFVAAWPNILVFYFVQLAWFLTTIVAWFAILFTGRYPRGLFNFGVGAMRWCLRQWAYLLLLRDEYPPYSLSADAGPGNEVISTIIGAPMLAGYVALIVLAGVFRQGDSVVVVSYDDARAGHGTTAFTDELFFAQTIVTLASVEDPATTLEASGTGMRIVVFDLIVPVTSRDVGPSDFQLKDATGNVYSVSNIQANGSDFEGVVAVAFELPVGVHVRELRYDPGGFIQSVSFRFR